MGDVQFILGGSGGGGAAKQGGGGGGGGDEHSGPFRRRATGGEGGGSSLPPSGKAVQGKKRGMARELQGLLDSGALAAEDTSVPIVPTSSLIRGPAFKAKRGAEKTTKW